jgi:hypothetical protein
MNFKLESLRTIVSSSHNSIGLKISIFTYLYYGQEYNKYIPNPIDALFTRYALDITDFFSLLAIFPYPEGKMLWLHKYQVN